MKYPKSKARIGTIAILLIGSAALYATGHVVAGSVALVLALVPMFAKRRFYGALKKSGMR